MALLKYKDIVKMDMKQRKEKLNELKFELSKSSVTANKAAGKTKEIKRAIARLITSFKLNDSDKEKLKAQN